ncbi:MAG: twitching motility protein PilT [bacterium]|nr:twitching motility protein PilT [bacterium]
MEPNDTITVHLHLHDDLDTFIPAKKRQKQFDTGYRDKRSIKDLLQSYCIPPTEVGGIIVAGKWVDDSYIPADGDSLEVFTFTAETRNNENPMYGKENGPPTFLCDVHLYKLARRLRLLGFDTWFKAEWEDPELAEISGRENLILLTRDRGLLMRKRVARGAYIRNTDPEKQVEEILARLKLHALCSPFTRCLLCNGFLRKMDKNAPEFRTHADLIPEDVRQSDKEIKYCTTCDKAFWKGSHYKKLVEKIETYT